MAVVYALSDVYDDTGFGGSGEIYGGVVKHDLSDGSIQWQVTSVEFPLCVAVEPSTGEVVVGAFTGEIVGLSPDDGSQLWSMSPFSTSTPVNAIVAVPGGGFIAGAGEASTPPFEVIRFNADRTVNWTYSDSNDTEEPRTLSIANDTVVAGSTSVIRTLDLVSGNELLRLVLDAEAAYGEGDHFYDRIYDPDAGTSGALELQKRNLSDGSIVFDVFNLPADAIHARNSDLYIASNDDVDGSFVETVQKRDINDGSRIWAYELPTDWSVDPRAIFTTADSGVVFGDKSGDDFTYGYLIRLSADGSEVWVMQNSARRQYNAVVVAGEGPSGPSLPPKFWTDHVGTREIRRA